MAKFKAIYEIINPYFINDTKELKSLATKLSKRANQRMLRLERAKSVVTGESYSDYGAYREYAQDALSPGRARFETNYSQWSDVDIRRRIAKLNTFLNAKSSTVAGQREIEYKRISTFESGKWGGGRYSDDLAKTRKLGVATNKEFYDFLNSQTFYDLRNIGLTSEELVEFYDELATKYTPKEIEEKLTAALGKFRAEEDVPLKNFMDFLGLPPLD